MPSADVPFHGVRFALCRGLFCDKRVFARHLFVVLPAFSSGSEVLCSAGFRFRASVVASNSSREEPGAHRTPCVDRGSPTGPGYLPRELSGVVIEVASFEVGTLQQSRLDVATGPVAGGGWLPRSHVYPRSDESGQSSRNRSGALSVA